MCDVEDSESTGDDGKFFHALLLMWLQKFIGFVTTVKILFECCLPHTHTHALPSKVLKSSKICTLRFCNTPQYSLDIPPPECLLRRFARDTLTGYNLPVSKKKRNQCLHGLPFSQKLFFLGVYSSLSAVGLSITHSFIHSFISHSIDLIQMWN